MRVAKPSESRPQQETAEFDLISRVCDGDYEAFHELVCPYERSIYFAAKSVLQNEADAECRPLCRYHRQIMEQSQLLAHPLWVNLLVLVPLALYLLWRNRAVSISGRQLLNATIFAVAFGFVEAAVAVYLSAAAGLLPGYTGTLSEVQRLARATQLETVDIGEFPQSLLTVERLREVATIVVLVTVALLAASKATERCAIFLWTFAWWDVSYYAGLWATIRWPTSLNDLDVLFLIPVPWVAEVWFPLLVSALTLIAVGLSRRRVRI